MLAFSEAGTPRFNTIQIARPGTSAVLFVFHLSWSGEKRYQGDREDPALYLRTVLARVADHPINRTKRTAALQPAGYTPRNTSPMSRSANLDSSRRLRRYRASIGHLCIDESRLD